MSCNPHAFGAKLPTGAVFSPSHGLPQPSQFARFLPIPSPQWYLVCVSARAAYSHSDSLGRRYRPPVCCDSQAT